MRDTNDRPDNTEDIFAHRDDFVEELYRASGGVFEEGDYDDCYDWFNGRVLDVAHTSTHTADGIEPLETVWLLGCGGPTVRMTYNYPFDQVTYSHSWGWNPHTGREQTECDGSSSGEGFIRDAFETLTPHPADE